MIILDEIPSFNYIYSRGGCQEGLVLGDTTLCFSLEVDGTQGIIYVSFSSPQNGQLNIASIEQYRDSFLIEFGNIVLNPLAEDYNLIICFQIQNSYIDNFCPYYIPYVALAVNFGSVFASQVYEDFILTTWETMSESNSNYFEIMISKDLQIWNSLGIVPASGNSSIMKRYDKLQQFDGETGLYYLQILEYDYDGDITKSDVIYFSFENNKKLEEPLRGYDLSGRRIKILD